MNRRRNLGHLLYVWVRYTAPRWTKPAHQKEQQNDSKWGGKWRTNCLQWFFFYIWKIWTWRYSIIEYNFNCWKTLQKNNFFTWVVGFSFKLNLKKKKIYQIGSNKCLMQMLNLHLWFCIYFCIDVAQVIFHGMHFTTARTPSFHHHWQLHVDMAAASFFFHSTVFWLLSFHPINWKNRFVWK